jgi:hypothetical protein
VTAFKPYPELHVHHGQIDGLYRIEKTNGSAIFAGHFESQEDAERFVECWNACRRIAFPSAHIDATNDYTARLEQLRKDAWARAQELETHIRAAS